MRYIDSDALIEFIEARYDITWKDDYEGGIKDACVDIIEKIKNIPTADVVERKKGKWIPANNVGDCCYMCSICGYVYDAYSLRADNFCQSCGADMRKEVKS